MKNNELTIRNMKPEELSIAIDWAAAEGWNPGLHDAEVFFPTDPQGFFLACKGEKPVGCISAVKYGNDFGFVGFFIVAPEQRGHRIGIELGMQAGAWLGKRIIGIDGVEAKIKNYHSQYGFEVAHANIRYAGITTIKPKVQNNLILAAQNINRQQLYDFDRQHFPADRQLFLNNWLSMSDANALAAINPDNGRISGYGVIRKCLNGYKIGPLFATSPATAEHLLNALTTDLPIGTPYFLDLPEPNSDALELARKNNMHPVFKTARMYSGGMPKLQLNNIYGITSFELG